MKLATIDDESGTLVPVSDLRAALAVVTHIKEATKVEDIAKRMRDIYALSNDVGAANEYAAIYIEAARVVGRMIGPAQHGGAREGDQVQRDELAKPIPKATRAQYRAIAKHSDEHVVQYWESCNDAGDIMSKRGLAVWSGPTASLMTSNSDEWYTPPHVIEAARKTLGAIDLDPCTSEVAQKWIGATEYFTITDDGLSKDWHGRTWLNPPYGGKAKVWVKDLEIAYEDGAIPAAIALLNGTACKNSWFDPYWDRPHCWMGPLKFLDINGNEVAKAPFLSLAVYFGTQERLFGKHFSQVGHVFLPWTG